MLLPQTRWRGLCGNNCIFQQDGAPCHTAGSTKAWFEKKNIEVIPWLSASSDLNLIEHIWEEIVEEQPPQREEEEWQQPLEVA